MNYKKLLNHFLIFGFLVSSQLYAPKVEMARGFSLGQGLPGWFSHTPAKLCFLPSGSSVLSVFGLASKDFIERLKDQGYNAHNEGLAFGPINLSRIQACQNFLRAVVDGYIFVDEKPYLPDVIRIESYPGFNGYVVLGGILGSEYKCVSFTDDLAIFAIKNRAVESSVLEADLTTGSSSDIGSPALLDWFVGSLLGSGLKGQKRPHCDSAQSGEPPATRTRQD